MRYLQAARAHGDLLIVGLNSDASVRRNKGPERPINPSTSAPRSSLALDCVDAVSIFDEDTPADIIRRVQPDVLVKGADWPADRIVGRDTVEARGGRVIREPVEQGYSTSAIIERAPVAPEPISQSADEPSDLRDNIDVFAALTDSAVTMSRPRPPPR